ncbi:MAG: DNA-formamidopyrimidine glycosylase family protein [Chitinophagaceae bacterium]
MPEGPSIVILKEAIAQFNRKKVIKVSGNAKIDLKRMEGKTIRSIRSWGKHLLICFDGFFIRIHLLMFGTYRINERKTTPLRLSLQFKKDELNFYTAAITMTDGDPDETYDWTADVMNDGFDAKKALKKVKADADQLICDVLLDQEIFSGVGNIIKNEILFNTFIHPESKAGNIPPARMKALVAEAVRYSFDFLKWKKAFELKKHWLAYGKKKCPRCNIPLEKGYPGHRKRRSFFCNNCQILYEK